MPLRRSIDSDRSRRNDASAFRVGVVLSTLPLSEKTSIPPGGHGRRRARNRNQEVHVTIQFGLAQQLLKRHPQVLGHRLWSPSFGDLDNADGNHPVVVAVNDLTRQPTPRGTCMFEM